MISFLIHFIEYAVVWGKHVLIRYFANCQYPSCYLLFLLKQWPEKVTLKTVRVILVLEKLGC